MELKHYFKKINTVIIILGSLAIVFYFLHVILGTINYPGYDSLAQAVSDLTSDDSPSKVIARLFSSLYGVFSSLVALGLLITFKSSTNKLMTTGIYLLSIMYLVSAIGYALFPLSGSPENVFQNTMHIVVTIIVVLLTIISLIILIIAFKKANYKIFHYLTIITFFVLMVGAVLTNVVSKDYFGLVERFSVFSVVIYLGIISYFNFLYQRNLLFSKNN